MMARMSGDADGSLGELRETLRAQYSEVCRAHTAITDFREKLLALLPIASGTAIGLLVFQEDGSNDRGLLLLALGLLGVAVTFGLYLYEIRQIDLCKQLRNHGAWLEDQLGIEAGQFGGRRKPMRLREVYVRKLGAARNTTYERAEAAGLRVKDNPAIRTGWIGAEAAGFVVYHVVGLGWLALAIAGLVSPGPGIAPQKPKKPKSRRRRGERPCWSWFDSTSPPKSISMSCRASAFPMSAPGSTSSKADCW